MKIIVTTILFLYSTSAYAYSCADVKIAVATFGVAKLLTMAKFYGITSYQIKQARLCLKK